MLDLFSYYTSPQFFSESSYWQIFTKRKVNSVDPDQLASVKPADLKPHCFENKLHRVLNGKVATRE